jgi:DNA-directed RNA polymerase specialized sigma24 family protein
VSPQSSLFEFERDELENLDALTDAERAVYEAVEYDETGVREFARETDRRPGTVGNLLKRARLRLDDRDEEVADTW